MNEPSDPARPAANGSPQRGDGSGPPAAGDDFLHGSGDRAASGADHFVTTVNPRIVPAGSRSPAAGEAGQGSRRGVLVALAAFAVLALAGGAFALYGASGGSEPAQAGAGQETQWNGGWNDGSSALPAPTVSESAEDGEDGDGKGGEGKGDSPDGARPSGSGDAGKDRPPQGGGSDEPGPPGPPGNPGDGPPGGTVRLWSHNSDQCVHVPGGQGRDGTALEVQRCAQAAAQRFSIENDGTVRAFGLCMDVAGGSVENGAVIQLARCSGNPAQQFVLSEASDLVNPQADKCVAVRDEDVTSGTPLELRECSGDDSQKWSPR